MMTSFTLLPLVFIIRYNSAIGNDTKLRQLYYKIEDERMRTVRLVSGAPLFAGTGTALVVAGFVAVYMDTTVSLTLIATALVLIVAGCVGKGIVTVRYSHRGKE